jgi:hypothetical protein
VDLRPFAYWDCGFESRRGYGCLSVVSVRCCQLEISASGRVDHSPREVLPGVACLGMIKEHLRGGLDPLGLSSHEKKITLLKRNTNCVHHNGGRVSISVNAGSNLVGLLRFLCVIGVLCCPA